jgi:predicted nucleotidyltransferase
VLGYMPSMGIIMPTMGIKKSLPASKRPIAKRKPVVRAILGPAIGIASALFSGTQQKVLGLLFGQPDRSYLMTEIIARSGGGSGGVQRELARLEACGLVEVERVGRQSHYRANSASPIFAELTALVRKTVGLVDPLREALHPLRDQIELALVYGSVARGEAKANSDVDVLVVSDSLMPEDIFHVLSSVEQMLSRSIHPTLLKHSEFERRRRQSGSFVQRVLGGQVEWLIGEPSADRSAR